MIFTYYKVISTPMPSAQTFNQALLNAPKQVSNSLNTPNLNAPESVYDLVNTLLDKLTLSLSNDIKNVGPILDLLDALLTDTASLPTLPLPEDTLETLMDVFVVMRRYNDQTKNALSETKDTHLKALRVLEKSIHRFPPPTQVDVALEAFQEHGTPFHIQFGLRVIKLSCITEESKDTFAKNQDITKALSAQLQSTHSETQELAVSAVLSIGEKNSTLFRALFPLLKPTQPTIPSNASVLFKKWLDELSRDQRSTLPKNTLHLLIDTYVEMARYNEHLTSSTYLLKSDLPLLLLTSIKSNIQRFSSEDLLTTTLDCLGLKGSTKYPQVGMRLVEYGGEASIAMKESFTQNPTLIEHLKTQLKTQNPKSQELAIRAIYTLTVTFPQALPLFFPDLTHCTALMNASATKEEIVIAKHRLIRSMVCFFSSTLNIPSILRMATTQNEDIFEKDATLSKLFYQTFPNQPQIQLAFFNIAFGSSLDRFCKDTSFKVFILDLDRTLIYVEGSVEGRKVDASLSYQSSSSGQPRPRQSLVYFRDHLQEFLACLKGLDIPIILHSRNYFVNGFAELFSALFGENCPEILGTFYSASPKKLGTLSEIKAPLPPNASYYILDDAPLGRSAPSSPTEQPNFFGDDVLQEKAVYLRAPEFVGKSDRLLGFLAKTLSLAHPNTPLSPASPTLHRRESSPLDGRYTKVRFHQVKK